MTQLLCQQRFVVYHGCITVARSAEWTSCSIATKRACSISLKRAGERQRRVEIRIGAIFLGIYRQATTLLDDAAGEHMFGELRRGTWQDSPLQQALRAISNFAARQLKWAGFDGSAAEKHLELFELFKKEFWALRALWKTLRDHASQR